MTARQCFRCHKPAVERGLCEDHMESRHYSVPYQKKQNRWHTARRRKKKSGYGAQWKSISVAWLRDHPMCVRCEQRDRRVVAVHADHIIPVSVAPARVHDLTNIQSLCRSCHTIKTNYERAGRYFDYENMREFGNESP